MTGGREQSLCNDSVMVIDRSGTWWTGDSAADLDDYLREFTADGYPVERVVHARCERCQGTVFLVGLDEEEGAAERCCTGCDTVVALLDSADHLADADVEDAACPCGGEEFNVAVGFAFHDDGDVRWVYLGLRCAADGVLGCYADWKIDYSPSADLVNRV